MRLEQNSKPLRYKIFWGVGLAVLLLLLWRITGSALFSLYILILRFSEYGFSIFNLANFHLLYSQSAFGVFFFSWKAIFSLFFIATNALITRYLSVYIISQFVLPVKSLEDRQKARDSFLSFINGEYKMAVFVKEGKIIESHGESENSRGGVILVDLSSAVALSQQEDTQSWNIVDGLDDEVSQNTHPRLKQNPKKEHGSFVEAKGPGLVFIENGQKISNVIDLRPQSRKEEVLAYTRNGIQVSSQVSVTFSLSDEPEIIPIGYVDTSKGVELRWLNIEEVATAGVMRVKNSFRLDEHDVSILNDYAANKPGKYSSPEVSQSAINTPYKFYRERVFNAAYSKARSVSSGKVIPWHEVPLEIAIELFRKELLTIPYEDLYVGLSLGKKDAADAIKHSVDALAKLKDSYSRKMRLKGIVAFQFFSNIENNKMAYFHEGDTVALKNGVKSSLVSLTHHSFNSLRSIGVVIKSAGFGNLQPTSIDIKYKMIDNWKARWEKEVEFINAEHDLETVRIQNRNRAEIQQEMTHLLSGIFQGSHTDEALALRVFQALESVATNPGAKNEISPKEVVRMLDSLHRWLLIDRRDLQPEVGESKKNQAGTL